MSDAARTAVIQRWLIAKDNAAKWAVEERRLRDFIAAQFGYNPLSPAQSIGNGTHRLDIGNGYGLKLVTSERLSIKEGPAFDAFVTAMRNPSLSGGRQILDNVIRWKPELRNAEYKTMKADMPGLHALLSPAVESKPNAPQLELEGP